MANPQNQNFQLTHNLIENFLKDLFGSEDCLFSSGVSTINLSQPLAEIFGGEENIKLEDAMYALQDPQFLQDMGLLLILNN